MVMSSHRWLGRAMSIGSTPMLGGLDTYSAHNILLHLDDVYTVRLWSPFSERGIRVLVAGPVFHCEAGGLTQVYVVAESKGSPRTCSTQYGDPQKSRGCSRKKTNIAQYCNRFWSPNTHVQGTAELTGQSTSDSRFPNLYPYLLLITPRLSLIESQRRDVRVRRRQDKSFQNLLEPCIALRLNGIF